MLWLISNEREYEDILERICVLMQKELTDNTKQGNELAVLALLVKDYEQKNHPVPKPNPIEAIKFRMEQMGISEKQLATI